MRVRSTPSLAPRRDAVQHTGWARWRPFLLYVLPLVVDLRRRGRGDGRRLGHAHRIAAVGALATMVFAARLSGAELGALLQALRGTAAISAMILFIILGATTFAQILSFSGASNGLVQAITGQGLSPRR